MATGHQCKFCGGTGRCARCRGSATDGEGDFCSDCLGTGTCKECKGSGEGIGRIREMWRTFDSLDLIWQKTVVAAAVGIVVFTFLFWRVAIPLAGLAVAVTIYLHITRIKDSL